MTKVSSSMPPFTAREQRVQDQIDAFNEMSHEDILEKYGDYTEKYEPTFKDSVLGGNLDHARKDWDRAEWRKYYALEAADYALCFGKTLAALPAKIIVCVQNRFGKDSLAKQEMRDRDIQDLKDSMRFIFLGAIYTIGKAACILLDPLVFLYRFIDQKIINPGPRAALLLVDPQYDFFDANDDLEINGESYSFEGGALPVTDSWKIVPVIASLQKAIKGLNVGCMDNHPLHHGATIVMQGGDPEEMGTINGLPTVKWSVHCVQGSRGQQYVPGIIMKLISRIFKKGMDPRVDSYSAFYDNDHKTKTRLSEYLKANGVTDLFVVGLAEDYCVGYSALDAQNEGFRTTVVTDATQCVAEDSQRKMRKKLEKAGVEMTTSEELLENSPFFSKRK